MQARTIVGSFLLAVALIACGGGGSNTSDGTGGTAGGGGTAGAGGAGGTGGTAGAGGTGGAGGTAGAGGTGGTGGTAGAGGTGGAGGSGGSMANFGPPASDLVSSGNYSTSPNYKLVWTMGQSTQNQGKGTSPNFRLQGGLVGANGSVQ